MKGEIVAVRIGTLVEHYGIYSGEGSVISASKRRLMICEESLQKFSQGRKIYSKGYPSNLQPQAVVFSAREKIGQEWSLFNNCQHFATDCHDKRQSPDLLFAACTIAIFAGIFWLIRPKVA